MLIAEDIVAWIESGLPGSRVTSSEGDGHHFNMVVVSERFDGKNALARHRLVYEALGTRMQEEIHALSLKTFTPSEYASLSES